MENGGCKFSTAWFKRYNVFTVYEYFTSTSTSIFRNIPWGHPTILFVCQIICFLLGFYVSQQICNFEFARFVTNGRSSEPISHHRELHQWMAPEQLVGKPADRPGDVYSYGVTIMECVTMRTPFAEIKTITQLKYPRQDPRIKKIPRKWSRIISVLVKETLAYAADRPTFEQVRL